MAVTKEIIDGKEYFHEKSSNDYGYNYYIGNFSFELKCTSTGVASVIEFDAWGSSWPVCCFADIAVKADGGLIYSNSGFRISETKQRYRIETLDVPEVSRVTFCVYDLDAHDYVPLVSFNDFWIFKFRVIRSVQTETGYSITYEIYNLSRRACKLPVEIKDINGNVINYDIISFSTGQEMVTKTFGSSTKVRAYAYKPDCSYTHEYPYYLYKSDPTDIANELAFSEVLSSLEVVPEKEEIETYPRVDTYVKFKVTNGSRYDIEVTLDLTYNSTPVNYPKTVAIPAGGSAAVQWTLHFPDYGRYEVCPKILGIRLV